MSESKLNHRVVVINNITCEINGVEYEIEPAKESPNLITTSKYTVVNFIPRNLFEQFRRLANFYFLVISFIQIVSKSPVTPATSLVPLGFVISVTALKQAYEDYLRHKTDGEINSRLVSIMRNDGGSIGTVKQVRSQDIRPGDLVSISDHQEIPVDMVLVSTGLVDGKCFVMTANLDGESNLQEKETLSFTKNSSPSDLSILKGIIECDHPNSDLYDFTGQATIIDRVNDGPVKSTLNVRNLVMRGSKLKNSKFAYGIAVYTGHDTKLALNSKTNPNKFSSVEAAANFYLAGYLAILLFTTFFCTIVNFIMTSSTLDHWYLVFNEGTDVRVREFIEIALSYFVLLNYLIPISLYVTLEVVKFIGSNKLVRDPELIDPVTGEGAKCNSSDLNEELGQVEYLFSDKTGTLTENKMHFVSCCIGDDVYTHESLCELQVQGRINESTRDFFLAVVTCTSVHVQRKVDSDKEEYSYSADSPDELTLVEAAAKFGVQLIYNTSEVCRVHLRTNEPPQGEIVEFAKLMILPFDAYRKRMSVIIQSKDGTITMVTKGADIDITSWISSGPIDDVTKHIESFSTSGLRTLIVARKILTLDQVESLRNLVSGATFLEKGRMINVYQTFERELQLLGAVAIEDKLQEGVEDAIEALMKAGIKIWLLTGDKEETASAVARSSKLITPEMIELKLSRINDIETCGEQIIFLLDKTYRSNEKYVLIVDGRSLYFAMKSHLIRFRSLCSSCHVVICCRMSPIQKAEVVKMIKNSPSAPITAAIGDGANDVSMIQEAHVGFGLMGREGRQAVNSSDFAFSQFRFIKRVLFVHGNLFYHRVSTLIHYFFYKNVVFVTPQFLYTFYNLYSSQTLYEIIELMTYNLVYTSFPILIYGIHEEYLPKSVLQENPEIYKKNSRNSNMGLKRMASWFINGAFHGAAIFYFYSVLWRHSVFQNGLTLGIFDMGASVFHCVVVLVNYKLFLISHKWSRQMVASSISITLVFALHILWEKSPLRKLPVPFSSKIDYSYLISSGPFWFSLFILPQLALLPDAISQSISGIYRGLAGPAYSHKRQ